MRNPTLTKRQAQEYMRRYRLMNRLTQAEQRRATPLQRAQQVGAIMGFSLGLKWRTFSPSQIHSVRQRWRRLREHYRAGK